MISNGGTSTLGLYDFKKQLDAFGGVDYFRSTLVGGYIPNARVMLDDGSIVQNKTNSNLTNNPNTDMTGWVNLNSANQVIDKSGRTQQSKNDDKPCVMDYNAIGDGVLRPVSDWYTVGSSYYRKYDNLAAVQADYPHVTSASDSIDWVAIQAGINALPNGGSLFVTPQKFMLNKTLTFPSAKYWQGTEGTAFTDGGSGAGVYPVFDFTNLPANSVGIQGGGKTRIENLTIIGNGVTVSGTSTALKTNNNFHLEGVVLLNWDIGINISTSYYSRFKNVNCRYCGLGVHIAYCFNLSIENLYVQGLPVSSRPSGVNGNGILIDGAASQVKLKGGSFEGYWGNGCYGIKLNSTGATLSLDGVYFESYGDATHMADAALLITSGKNVVTIKDSYAYCYYQTNFVNASAATSLTLKSYGNKFTGDVSGYTPTIYNLPPIGSLFACDISLSGDNTDTASGGVPVYVTPTLTYGALQNCAIQPPSRNTDATYSSHEYLGRPVVNRAFAATPSNPTQGTIYWADGVSWNPFYSTFKPYPVIYDGTTFKQVVRVNNLVRTAATTFTLTPNQNAFADTASNAVTVKLPSSPLDGDTHTVKVFNGAKDCTVDGNGVLIDSSATYSLPSSTYHSITVTYNAFTNRWMITNKVT